MSDVIRYEALTADLASAAATTLRPVYAAVFSQPPYNEGSAMADKFLTWIIEESQNPGFSMIIAYDGAQPIGFAYGYTMAAGTWFRHAADAIPEIQAADKFVVMEWAVLDRHRGNGVGRTLMTRLLADRPEPWAVLTVNPAANARSIYERAGWHKVGATVAGSQWPSMDIMVLEHPSSGSRSTRSAPNPTPLPQS